MFMVKRDIDFLVDGECKGYLKKLDSFLLGLTYYQYGVSWDNVVIDCCVDGDNYVFKADACLCDFDSKELFNRLSLQVSVGKGEVSKSFIRMYYMRFICECLSLLFSSGIS